MGYTKDDWKAYKSRPQDPDSWEWEVSAGNTIVASRINEANTRLIASAVNACIKLNPNNPQAVAESIGELYKALKNSTTIIHNQIRYEDGKHREYLQQQLKANLEALSKAEDK